MLNPETGFTLTLGKLIAVVIGIIGLSFTIGMSYQSLLPDRELQREQTEKIQKIEVTLERVTTVLEKLEERSSQHGTSISDVQSKVHMINADVQVIGSYVRSDRKYR